MDAQRCPLRSRHTYDTLFRFEVDAEGYPPDECNEALFLSQDVVTPRRYDIRRADGEDIPALYGRATRLETDDTRYGAFLPSDLTMFGWKEPCATDRDGRTLPTIQLIVVDADDATHAVRQSDFSVSCNWYDGQNAFSLDPGGIASLRAYIVFGGTTRLLDEISAKQYYLRDLWQRWALNRPGAASMPGFEYIRLHVKRVMRRVLKYRARGYTITNANAHAWIQRIEERLWTQSLECGSCALYTAIPISPREVAKIPKPALVHLCLQLPQHGAEPIAHLLDWMSETHHDTRRANLVSRLAAFKAVPPIHECVSGAAAVLQWDTKMIRRDEWALDEHAWSDGDDEEQQCDEPDEYADFENAAYMRARYDADW